MKGSGVRQGQAGPGRQWPDRTQGCGERAPETETPGGSPSGSAAGCQAGRSVARPLATALVQVAWSGGAKVHEAPFCEPLTLPGMTPDISGETLWVMLGRPPGLASSEIHDDTPCRPGVQ